MAADLTKSIPHILEDLFLTTPGIKDIIKIDSVASSNPTDTTALANASSIVTATVTATGVAVGDAVLAIAYESGLAANQLILGAYVSATDTITLVIGNVVNTTVTTTAVTASYIVADLT
jgi:putative methionine-R-sulfoxide reductase with GAF domain